MDLVEKGYTSVSEIDVVPYYNVIAWHSSRHLVTLTCLLGLADGQSSILQARPSSKGLLGGGIFARSHRYSMAVK